MHDYYFVKNNFVERIVPIGILRFLQRIRPKTSTNYSLERIDDVDISIQDSLERHIKRISFEISNTCNYTKIHPECPVSWYGDKLTLKKEVLFKIIDELSLYDYSGFIAFHRYNEPMINKERLFSYIKYVNQKLPDAKIVILTNGSYLFQEDLERFEDYKIWSISVSSYTKEEHYRLKKLVTKIPYQVFYSLLDDRESIYTREPIDLNVPCFATIRDITVNVYGQVSLCCYDWDNQVVFGDLNRQSLKEVLNSDGFLTAHKDLTNGRRNYEICKRCNTYR